MSEDNVKQVRSAIEEALIQARKDGADQVMNAILQGKIKLPPLDKTIFVNIAAYCEPHLEMTLDSMFANAMLPQNLRVGLFDQSDHANIGWLRKKPYWKQIRYLNVDHTQARGSAWARAISSTLYANEDYYLQVDGHTVFDPGWDRTLIDALTTAEKKVEKPIITTYPMSFTIEDGKPVIKSKRQDQVFMMGLNKNADLSKQAGVNYGANVYFEKGGFKEGFHIAGGFIFTRGHWLNEVPQDPMLYFAGQEINLAVRSFTHGWTILHPNDKYIPLYHLYKNDDTPKTTLHWNSEHDESRAVKWTEQHALEVSRQEDLLFHGKDLGAYGLGTKRTLKDFATMSGIDFPARNAEARAYADKVKPEKKG